MIYRPTEFSNAYGKDSMKKLLADGYSATIEREYYRGFTVERLAFITTDRMIETFCAYDESGEEFETFEQAFDNIDNLLFQWEHEVNPASIRY